VHCLRLRSTHTATAQQHPRVARVAPRAVFARLDRRTEPAHPRVARVAPRAVFARLDRAQTGSGPVFQHPPDRARRMRGADQLLVIHGLQYQLLTIGFPQPHFPRPSPHLRLSSIFQFPPLNAIPSLQKFTNSERSQSASAAKDLARSSARQTETIARQWVTRRDMGRSD